jgi:hypothetical protein
VSFVQALSRQRRLLSCVVAGPDTAHGAERLLNERHMLFAWLSLFSVGLADLYVRLVAAGVITDLRLL